ncbi:heterokaryon incompatibility protein-domain-containing protein [Trametes meyenii]|nr:heterokaryon incompatibility protein-domain-containing protein [Trametes meyenii]
MPRFLNTRTGEFEEKPISEDIRYAILSHRWRSGGEQSYEDVLEIQKEAKFRRAVSQSLSEESISSPSHGGSAYSMQSGSQFSLTIEDTIFWDESNLDDKVRQFCKVARDEGFSLAWIDSCCINKTSSAELSEAINSMYEWYRRATVCYAYLADVSDSRADEPNSVSSDLDCTDVSSFAGSERNPGSAGGSNSADASESDSADGSNFADVLNPTDSADIAHPENASDSADASVSDLADTSNLSPIGASHSDLSISYIQTGGVSQGAQFEDSDWHTRGWTLQELIAPREVVFLTKNWLFFSTKFMLAKTLERITGIDFRVLTGSAPLESISVSRRMWWAAHRTTTREEDRAYCLLGIFGVHLPTIYGEGPNAFIRLQEEILKKVPDQSIFAWGPRCVLSITVTENAYGSHHKHPSAKWPPNYRDHWRNHHPPEIGLLASSPGVYNSEICPMSVDEFARRLLPLAGLDSMTARIMPPPMHCLFTPQGVRVQLLCVEFGSRFSDVISVLVTCTRCRERGTFRSLAILRCNGDDNDILALPLLRRPKFLGGGLPASVADYDGYLVTTHIPCRADCDGSQPSRIIGLTDRFISFIRNRATLEPRDVFISTQYSLPMAMSASRTFTCLSAEEDRFRTLVAVSNGKGTKSPLILMPPTFPDSSPTFFLSESSKRALRSANIRVAGSESPTGCSYSVARTTGTHNTSTTTISVCVRLQLPIDALEQRYEEGIRIRMELPFKRAEVPFRLRPMDQEEINKHEHLYKPWLPQPVTISVEPTVAIRYTSLEITKQLFSELPYGVELPTPRPATDLDQTSGLTVPDRYLAPGSLRQEGVDVPETSGNPTSSSRWTGQSVLPPRLTSSSSMGPTHRVNLEAEFCGSHWRDWANEKRIALSYLSNCPKPFAPSLPQQLAKNGLTIVRWLLRCNTVKLRISHIMALHMNQAVPDELDVTEMDLDEITAVESV